MSAIIASTEMVVKHTFDTVLGAYLIGGWASRVTSNECTDLSIQKFRS